jgi:hypothetical protein
MQIDKEGIQNLLMNMVLEKKKLKKKQIQKKPIHASSFGNGVNKFYFGTTQFTTTTYET